MLVDFPKGSEYENRCFPTKLPVEILAVGEPKP